MQATPDLVIDSVTGVDVTLPVAGPGARSYAFLVDWCIRSTVAIAWYVVAALLYNRSWDLLQPLTPDARWFALVVTPPAIIYLLYHPILEIAMRGTTPGKRIAGVQIVAYVRDTADATARARAGAPPSIGELLTRNVFRVVDSFPLFYPVGLIATMLTDNHVRVGDIAAGTVLVYRSPPPQHTSPPTPSDATAFVDSYRLLASRVAKTKGPSRGSVQAEYALAHSSLYTPRWRLGPALLRLFRDEIPDAVHDLRGHIAWATTIFVLTVAAGYGLVRSFPGLIALFSSPELIASVEKGQLWTDGMLNVVPSSVLSLQILANNIAVSVFAYCAGFLFGLGTIYIVGLNGMMLGAVFAFTGEHGLEGNLFRFIVAHGLVEISVMCLSGAAGAAVGEALIRPKHGSRAESFRVAASQSGKLLFACALLLVGAGLIEGYISPDPDVPLWARVAVGSVYWLVMLALLRGWFFRWRWARPVGHPPSYSPGAP
ncbi:MAG TPA: stage II sporulation protein M [Steroidobacteraceae bacterium]|jgi:uncharacterized membrane protein SpoIIM required for sporulation/uncharacterized RDD family membrane protein YckC